MVRHQYTQREFEDFVRAYALSETYEDLYEMTGRDAQDCSRIKGYLRLRGIKLPKLRKARKKLDINYLNRLFEDMSKKKRRKPQDDKD